MPTIKKKRFEHETEPLIELLYQEFQNEDPKKIERIMITITKWLEQEITRIQSDKKAMNEQNKTNFDLNPIHDGTIIELMCLTRDLKKQIKE